MELVTGPPQDDPFPVIAGYSRQTLFDPQVELLWLEEWIAFYRMPTCVYL
jgi:hypothetical protein